MLYYHIRAGADAGDSKDGRRDKDDAALLERGDEAQSPDQKIDKQERPEQGCVPAELFHDRDEVPALVGVDFPLDAGGHGPGHLVFIKKIL